MIEALQDSLLDSIKIFPFLFLVCLIMEYIGHQAGKNHEKQIRQLNRYGPLFGGVLGILPQCGFSSAASDLYARRIITLGTLLSVYLSTSDEMLPILIARAVPPVRIIQILLLKVFVGVLSGTFIDRLIRTEKPEQRDCSFYSQAGGCQEDCSGIWCPSLRHSLSILLFLFVITSVLNYIFALYGENRLSGFWLNRPVVGEVLAGLIGLIPNCAASVLLTELYLEGGLSFSAMMSGLFVGSGVGILVLFRENHGRWKENIRIIGLLYGIGVIAGLGILLSQNVPGL
ncbi:MAG TPA: hypothetical protein DD414_02015 [Lachnospiraceae bacterium]|nr:hypothetical protein [Lachnospiraceae bacterium]